MASRWNPSGIDTTKYHTDNSEVRTRNTNHAQSQTYLDFPDIAQSASNDGAYLRSVADAPVGLLGQDEDERVRRGPYEPGAPAHDFGYWITTGSVTG
jgi:hypothetical protein